MRRGIALSIVAIAALASVAFAGTRGVEFIPLGIPAGAPGSFGTTITGDGMTVAGSAGGFGAVGGCIVWEEATGWTILAYETGACYMSRDGMSFTADVADGLGYIHAARWNGSEFVMVPDAPGAGPCGSTVDTGYQISGDGSTIVGLAYEGGCGSANSHAFQSTEAGGTSYMTKLNAPRAARANVANWDGSVLGGWNDNVGRQGIIWRDGVPEWVWDSTADPSRRAGEVYALNSDGSAAAGIGYSGPDSRGGWIWTEADGLRGTGSLPGFGSAYNFAMNETGTMAGGAFGFGPFRDATLWTEATGLMNLNQFLINQGLTVYFDGWRIFQVNAMDDRGTRMVVFAKNPSSALLPNESVLLDISKVSVCHAPPGMPSLARTSNIAWESVADHLGHGDFLGTCEAAAGAHGRASTAFEHFGVNPNNPYFREAVNAYSAEHSVLMPFSPEGIKSLIEAGRPQREAVERIEKDGRQRPGRRSRR